MVESIFLAGGGGKEDSKTLDNFFVKQLKSHRPDKIAYIPIAMTSRSYQECFKWFKSVFMERVKNLQMWTDLQSVSHEEMQQFGAIYIGGGNAAKLLEHIRRSGFDTKLSDYIAHGGIVYGGSAGAIVLGKSILTAPEARKQNLDNYAGLDLLDGYSVVCHYSPTEKQRGEVLQLTESIGSPIIAIPERSGIVKSDSKLLVLGSEPVDFFTVEKTISQVVPANNSAHM